MCAVIVNRNRILIVYRLYIVIVEQHVGLVHKKFPEWSIRAAEPLRRESSRQYIPFFHIYL